MLRLGLSNLCEHKFKTKTLLFGDSILSDSTNALILNSTVVIATK